MKKQFLVLIAAIMLFACKKTDTVRELPGDTEVKIQKLPVDRELYNEFKDEQARAYKKGGNGHGQGHGGGNGGGDTNPPPPPPPPPPPTVVHKACWLIDVDGYVIPYGLWSPYQEGYPVAGSGFTATQNLDVLNRVRAYWSQFDVEITMDEALYQTYPIEKRMRVVITTTNFYGPAGGVAYMNSLNWIDTEKQCFVFPQWLATNTKYTADAAAHEMGHTAGCPHHKDLRTDESGLCYVYGEYLYSFHLMGASYYDPSPRFGSGFTACEVPTDDFININNAINQ